MALIGGMAPSSRVVDGAEDPHHPLLRVVQLAARPRLTLR
jgi:hypothetical protein